MKKDFTLQQKIKQIRKLDCLLSIVSTITILGTIILLALAFIFKPYFAALFGSGIGCFALVLLVNHFQMRVIHKESVLNTLKLEEDFYPKKPSRCELCDITFDSKDQLLLELKKDGYGDCHYCPKCGKKLTNKAL